MIRFHSLERATEMRIVSLAQGCKTHATERNFTEAQEQHNSRVATCWSFASAAGRATKHERITPAKNTHAMLACALNRTHGAPYNRQGSPAHECSAAPRGHATPSHGPNCEHNALPHTYMRNHWKQRSGQSRLSFYDCACTHDRATINTLTLNLLSGQLIFSEITIVGAEAQSTRR